MAYSPKTFTKIVRDRDTGLPEQLTEVAYSVEEEVQFIYEGYTAGVPFIPSPSLSDRIALLENIGVTVPLASDTIPGRVELATPDETFEGGADNKAVTPFGLLQTLLEKIDDLVAGSINTPDSATEVALAAAIDARGTVVDARNYANPQAAITAAPVGSTVWFDPRTTWTLTTDLTVSKPLSIKGDNTLISQTGVGKAGFTVTSSDVHFDGLDLQGRQSGTLSGSERAIDFLGTNAGTRLLRTSVRNCRIRRWGYCGLFGKFLSKATWENLTVEDICYAGIAGVGVEVVKLTNSTVDGILQGVGAPDSYGVTFSNDEAVGGTARSGNVKVENVTVRNVPSWAALDTHGGVDISFKNCEVYNAKLAISCVPGRFGSGAYTLAPKGISIEDCTVNSGLTNGAFSVGIQISGPSTNIGFHNNTEWATGMIRGNVVRGYGNQAASSGCALSIKDTLGVIIANNVFIEPASSAIQLDYNNKDAVITGNTFIDVWTNTGAIAVGINMSSAWNTCKVGGNVITRGTKSATLVNSGGLRMGSALASTCVDLGNDFSAAATPMSQMEGLIWRDQNGIKEAFVSAAPTWGVWPRGSKAWSYIPTASTSPGWINPTGGASSSATWAASTAYSNATWVKTSTGKVFECVGAGTSSTVEPTAATIGAVVTDGGVTWVYRAATVAVFKTMAALGA